MAVFDRDPSLERRQIQEIAANVARRLLTVLDGSKRAHPALRAEIDEAVTVITGIQRDVDDVVTAMPAGVALDIAILTHILGGLQHALERLEDLEIKLKSEASPLPTAMPSAAAPDQARSHAALIAIAREIERDALRYGAPMPSAPLPHPAPMYRATAGPQPHFPATGPPQWPAPAQGGTPRRAAPPPARVKTPPRAAASWLANLGLPQLLETALPRTALVVAVVAMLAAGAWSLLPARAPAPDATAGADTGTPSRDDTSRLESTAATRPSLTQSFATAAATAPNLEQPYLVVLTTRRSTEELQQDYRSFKQTYGALLTGSKARVDRIQGQDRQTYYRLSLIPPQSHAEAKTLCSRLRLAGLSGCWIRQVPVN